MGDQTDLFVYHMKDDLQRFIGKLFEPESMEPDPIQWSHWVEVNYGGTYLLGELANLGLLFYGYHGSGYDYPAMAFVSDGYTLHEVLCVHDDGTPLVTVDTDTGEVREADLELARKYCAVLNEVQAKMEEKALWQAPNQPTRQP